MLYSDEQLLLMAVAYANLNPIEVIVKLLKRHGSFYPSLLEMIKDSHLSLKLFKTLLLLHENECFLLMDHLIESHNRKFHDLLKEHNIKSSSATSILVKAAKKGKYLLAAKLHLLGCNNHEYAYEHAYGNRPFDYLSKDQQSKVSSSISIIGKKQNDFVIINGMILKLYKPKKYNQFSKRTIMIK
jgi:hypothetical protein